MRTAVVEREVERRRLPRAGEVQAAVEALRALARSVDKAAGAARAARAGVAAQAQGGAAMPSSYVAAHALLPAAERLVAELAATTAGDRVASVSLSGLLEHLRCGADALIDAAGMGW